METPLLDDPEEISGLDDKTSTVTIPQLLVRRHLRKPLIIVSFAMLSQQLSGKFHIQFRQIRLLYSLFRYQRRLALCHGCQSHRSHQLDMG
jgi:hypothetical protein